MTKVLGSVLSVQVHVGTVTVKVSSPSLHLKLVSCSALLQRVEDVQAVIFVELEGFADLFRAVLITVVVVILLVILLFAR